MDLYGIKLGDMDIFHFLLADYTLHAVNRVTPAEGKPAQTGCIHMLATTKGESLTMLEAFEFKGGDLRSNCTYTKPGVHR